MLNPADAAFAETLSAAGVTIKPADAAYLEEPRGLYAGTSQFVALPRSAEDVATIVKACAAARVGIVPYGGGTGLVSGQISPDAPLILSLEKMNAIRAVYPEEDTLIAEAGAIVADVQNAAEEAGRLFPLSYGAHKARPGSAGPCR